MVFSMSSTLILVTSQNGGGGVDVFLRVGLLFVEIASFFKFIMCTAVLSLSLSLSL